MKKKILLKTLIPLASVGITLGTALPLVSCSCGNNDDNGESRTFSNMFDLVVFMIGTCNSALTTEDSTKNWSTGYQGGDDSYPVNDLDMIAWFNKIIDAKIFMMLYMFEGAGQVDFNYPCEFQYIDGTASFKFTKTSEDPDIHPEIVYAVTKNLAQNSFDLMTIEDGYSSPKYGSISKAGTHTDAPNPPYRAIVFNGNITVLELPDPSTSNFWSGVQFPIGDPVPPKDTNIKTHE